MSNKQAKTLRRRRVHKRPTETKNLIEEARLFEDIQEVRSFFKRTFDIIFSLFALVVTLPIWLTIPLLIRLTSRGKAIYAAERMGQGGRKIYCYKFRSMCIDADKKLEAWLKTSEEIRKEWDKNLKLVNDPRITFIGKFIRKTSIDEIPQFWNVLKGDLSVVGPRPRAFKECPSLPSKHLKRLLAVKPGVTGLWQTSGRNRLTSIGRMELDDIYLQRAGFFYDMYLILKTIPTVLLCYGAR